MTSKRIGLVSSPVYCSRLLLFCFFVFAWMAVFNVAFMNGDDVVHFASTLQSSLLPKINRSWTPNRVIDIYGRTILSSIFGFLFSSINGFVRLEFFVFYKIFSASLFALFQSIVLWYFLKIIPRVHDNKLYGLAFPLLVAALVFQVFPWRNQVHFICYQFPAFLTFVLLRWTVDEKSRQMNAAGMTPFVLLSYICAFSLESFALAIFLVSALLLVVELKPEICLHRSRWLDHVRSRLRAESYPKLLLVNLGFCSLALLIAMFLSQRSQGAADVSYAGGLQALLRSRLAMSGVVLLGAGGWWLFAMRLRESADARRFAAGILFAMYLVGATLIVTCLISVKAGVDYFSPTDYPWGDLMLVGKLAAIYLLGISIARWATQRPKAQPWLTLLLIVGFSKVFHFSLEQV